MTIIKWVIQITFILMDLNWIELNLTPSILGTPFSTNRLAEVNNYWANKECEPEYGQAELHPTIIQAKHTNHHRQGQSPIQPLSPTLRNHILMLCVAANEWGFVYPGIRYISALAWLVLFLIRSRWASCRTFSKNFLLYEAWAVFRLKSNLLKGNSGMYLESLILFVSNRCSITQYCFSLAQNFGTVYDFLSFKLDVHRICVAIIQNKCIVL